MSLSGVVETRLCDSCGKYMVRVGGDISIRCESNRESIDRDLVLCIECSPKFIKNLKRFFSRATLGIKKK